MKLLSFRVGGETTFGVLAGDRVIDVKKTMAGKYADIKAVLSADALGEVQAAIGAGSPVSHALKDIEYLPVIPNPTKIFCVGLNYRSHAAESGKPPPERPFIFARWPGSQVGHDQPMLLPRESEQFDFEGEIAVIIGQGGRRIPEADGWNHVAGYAPYNDGSVRDWQFHSTQWILGKNFAATGAFGPWMITSDEVGPDPDLTLVTRLNGQEVQRAHFSDLLFSIPYLISYCSAILPLEPGDVIITGTPGGVGVARKPPLWMKDGDVCEVEVTPIGILRSPIKAD